MHIVTKQFYKNLGETCVFNGVSVLSVLWALTILCACPKQVDDVLVFANHFHHLHLRHKVRQVLVSAII